MAINECGIKFGLLYSEDSSDNRARFNADATFWWRVRQSDGDQMKSKLMDCAWDAGSTKA
jgi:hypothetical protein